MKTALSLLGTGLLATTMLFACGDDSSRTGPSDAASGSDTSSGGSLAEQCNQMCMSNNAMCGDSLDCGSFCPAAIAVSAAGGCNDQLGALATCQENAADRCMGACDAELSTWGGCVAAYCGDNQTDADCQTVFAAVGGG